MPEVKTNLKDFILWQAGALDHILKALLSELFQKVNILVRFHGVGGLLNKTQVLSKNRADRDADLFAEHLEAALLLTIEQGPVFFS